MCIFNKVKKEKRDKFTILSTSPGFLRNCINCIHNTTARISLHLILFPQFLYHLFHIHLSHSSHQGNIKTHNWLAPNISGFIAQLVRASHRYREVTGSNPVEVLNFFRLLTQLHKLSSQMRGSFFIWRSTLQSSFTVANNCHVKYKLITSNTNCSHQKQNRYNKYNLPTSKTNCSHQILNCSHQKQHPYIKYKIPTSNTKSWYQITKSWQD